MRNKKFILILLILLAIGFAAVSTTLYITGNLAYQTKKDNFDVYFSGAEIEGIDVSNLVIKDKKHIEFTSSELKKINDKSILTYEVTNDSTEYDATVTISCAPMKNEYIEVVLDPNTFDIAASEVKQGNIETTLKRASESVKDVELKCELAVKATERTTIEDFIDRDNDYKISGTLTDADGNPLPRVKLAAFSDRQVIKTDKDGYFYIGGLERGIHHLYYIEEENEYNFSEDELKDDMLAIASTNGYLKIKNQKYKIANYKYGTNLEDQSCYCEYEEGQVWDFPYNGTNGSNGSTQPFAVSEGCDGTYKLEAWGAQGGYGKYGPTFKYGGYGGYAEGLIHLDEFTSMNIVVGGAGGQYYAGYNGGGNGSYANDSPEYSGGGGGATHITFNQDAGVLKNYGSRIADIIMVAAGGGGGSTCATEANENIISAGGSGGGYIGGSNIRSLASGATQSGTGRVWAGAGANGSFGQGGHGYVSSLSRCQSLGGGGGGYYGGVANNYSGTGGSGYIGHNDLYDKSMFCYGCSETQADGLKTVKTNEAYANAVSEKAKSGNGYARITLVSLD